jgi:hypothetical protein
MFICPNFELKSNMNSQGNVIIDATVVLLAVIFIVQFFIYKIFPYLEETTGFKVPDSFIIALILLIIVKLIGFFLLLPKKIK